MSLKKWMVALATVLVTTQFTPTSADGCGGYECETNDCDLCDDWSVYADWLYRNTRKCDLDYAFQEEEVSDSLTPVSKMPLR